VSPAGGLRAPGLAVFFEKFESLVSVCILMHRQSARHPLVQKNALHPNRDSSSESRCPIFLSAIPAAPRLAAAEGVRHAPGEDAQCFAFC